MKLEADSSIDSTRLSAKTTACMLSRFSHVQLFATLWTVACQAPLSIGISSQEYWSGLPCPPPGDLPNPWIEPRSLMSSALQVGSLPQRAVKFLTMTSVGVPRFLVLPSSKFHGSTWLGHV